MNSLPYVLLIANHRSQAMAHAQPQNRAGERVKGAIIPANDAQSENAPPNLPPFPAEIRNQIYHCLLKGKYIVNLPDTLGNSRYQIDFDYSKAFPTPIHPDLAPHTTFDWDTKAPWIYGLTPHDKRFCDLTPPKDATALLNTSRAIRHEAAPIFFANSTFVFSITSPRKDILSNYAVNRMRNIEVHLDLLTAYGIHRSTADPAYTFVYAREFIKRFGGSRIERETCIINIEYCERLDFLAQPSFLAALKLLTGFATVVIKCVPVYLAQKFKGSYAGSGAQSLGLLSKNILGNVASALQMWLGRAETELEREDFHCLVFHPLSFGKGEQAPGFDIEGLVEEMVPVSLQRPGSS